MGPFGVEMEMEMRSGKGEEATRDGRVLLRGKILAAAAAANGGMLCVRRGEGLVVVWDFLIYLFLQQKVKTNQKT